MYLFVDPGVLHWGQHGYYGTDEGEPRGKSAEWTKMKLLCQSEYNCAGAQALKPLIAEFS